jgi:hypothetical protein
MWRDSKLVVAAATIDRRAALYRKIGLSARKIKTS